MAWKQKTSDGMTDVKTASLYIWLKLEIFQEIIRQIFNIQNMLQLCLSVKATWLKWQEALEDAITITHFYKRFPGHNRQVVFNTPVQVIADHLTSKDWQY